ncbi:MAG: alpha/beta fold hydrolase [Tepidiformaceae bacterium]
MTDGIVLIHAFPLDSSMWAPQIEEFGKDVKVIAPDLPGFGSATPHGEVMSMSAAADEVARAIRDAGFEKSLVVGLSMGGYVALALWRQHPELVSGFVFANTKAEGDDEAGAERRRHLAARLRSEGSAFLVESPPPLLSEDAPDELITRVKGIIAGQTANAIAAAALGMAARPDSTPDLASIDVPTLVITSSKDTLIPSAATQPLAAGITNSRFEVIEGAGHLSNLEAPREFNELLKTHLDRVTAARG